MTGSPCMRCKQGSQVLWSNSVTYPTLQLHPRSICHCQCRHSLNLAARVCVLPAHPWCVVCADVHVLSALPWSSVVVDRRQRSRSAAGKAQLALQVGLRGVERRG